MDRDSTAVCAGVVSVLCTLFSLALLGLNLKLYTEHFKDRAIDKRNQGRS